MENIYDYISNVYECIENILTSNVIWNKIQFLFFILLQGNENVYYLFYFKETQMFYFLVILFKNEIK